MKHLKFLFLPIVVLSILSSVKAACVYDVWLDAWNCNPWDTCSQTNCFCNDTIPGVIGSGATCGTACPYDVGMDANVCIAGQYCPVWAVGWQCLCNGGSISVWAICTPVIGSCTVAWVTLYNGQSTTVFQAATVPYTGSCGGLFVTCNVVGWVGVLTPSAAGYSYSSCIQLPPPSGACTLPRWGTISSWSSVTAYQASSVACGSSCVSQTRTCNNGTLSWSYSYGSCSVNSCGGGWGWGWGGGGGSYSTCTTGNLICIAGTRHANTGVSCQWGNLGKSCTVGGTNNTWTLPVGSIAGSTRSAEMNAAYLRAYAHGITTMNTIHKADMWGVLIRSHMAKMISNFAITLGGMTPNTGLNCTFNDIGGLSSEMKFYVKLSCQLGLMGLTTNGTPAATFDPDTIVTRAQFGTILSRVIRWTLYNGGEPYYSPHLLALKNVGIMTLITNPTSINEIRGYVMIMMKRAYEAGLIGN